MFDINQRPEKYMNLVLTHQCNMKCPFCVDEYRGSDEYISLENVQRAIDHALHEQLDDVLLIGGEPTLHPQVLLIAQMVKEAGFRVIMTTNYTKPDVVKQLDGIVDCFNISYYHQKELPKQVDSYSDLTLHTLIHDKFLATHQQLDEFIDKHQANGHLKFSTLVPGNEWAAKHNKVDYLDSLDSTKVTLFDTSPGDTYRGAVNKRPE